jgi:glycosyltransferase involved in cell wall biosynthesis
MTAVHVVLPDGVDDVTRPSGGNVYDLRVCRGLAGLGWSVHQHVVPVAGPSPEVDARAALAGVVGALPTGSLVLVDGLVAVAAPDVLVVQARRVRLVVLVHMAADGCAGGPTERAEGAVLHAAAAVITTSAWSRRRLLEAHLLAATHVHVARPGVDTAALAPGSRSGGRLTCVASLTAGKGHEVLLAALGQLRDLAWTCVCVGSLVRDPAHAEWLRALVTGAGLDDRVVLAGPRTGPDLDATYAATDLLVLATRAESYGMVVPEALAHGVPVLATAVGGVPEALGRLPDGSRPGLLVPSGDPVELAAALRCWLTDARVRESLRRAARLSRPRLTPWTRTSQRVSSVLREVAC